MLLAKQLKLMQTTDHIPGISVGLVDDKDVFEWEVMLMINDECRLYGGEYWEIGGKDNGMANQCGITGGFFRAQLSFPKDYPHAPPKMKFETPIWHPNSTALFTFFSQLKTNPKQSTKPVLYASRSSIHQKKTAPATNLPMSDGHLFKHPLQSY